MDLGLTLTILGFVVAVVGLPATYLMGRRNRQRPDLCYLSDFDVLMSPDDGLAADTLDLTIGSQRITRVSRTYIAFWNHKGDTVSGADIVASDPLRITVGDDDAVLQARLISQSRVQCGVDVQFSAPGGGDVKLEFDFLDAKDGGILEILHQGDHAATLKGTIRGSQLRSRGSGRLTRSAIEAIAARSIIARFTESSRKRGRFALIYPLVALIFPLAATGLMTWALITRYLIGNPILIPTASLDMSTLDGQQQFVDAAAKAGFHSAADQATVPFSFALIALMIAMTFFTFYRQLSVKIPADIVAVRTFDTDTDSENDIASTG